MSEKPPEIQKRESSPRTKRDIAEAVIRELDHQHALEHGGEKYHSYFHTQGVRFATRDFFDTLGVPEDDERRLAAYIAAAGHDLVLRGVRGYYATDVSVQDRERAEANPIVIDGREMTGGDEGLSAEVIRSVLEKHDPDGVLATPAFLRLVGEAVKATYPSFALRPLPSELFVIHDPHTNKDTDLSPLFETNEQGEREVLYIDQPYLTQASGLEAVALALGDLAEVGRAPYQEFEDNGMRLFRETNPDIAEQLHKSLVECEPAEKRTMAKRMLDFLKRQVGFALGQKKRFYDIIDTNVALKDIYQRDPNVKQRLAKEYSKFDENILSAAQRYEEAQKTYGNLVNEQAFTGEGDALAQEHETFQNLVGEFGYIVLRA